MTRKLVAFRIDEELWKHFLSLVDESGRSAQDVLRECVKACLAARSTEVKLFPGGKSGLDLSYELRLRDTIQTLRSFMAQGNYMKAEWQFSSLTRTVRHIRDPTLLEEARMVAVDSLKWMKAYQMKT